MAKAKMQGEEYEVRVTQDLTDNWSVEVITPPEKMRQKLNISRRPFDEPPALIIKIRADTRESALKAGLDLLKRYGKIDDYVI
jgi:hypothetical protein